jgi:hypothetical protein
MEVVYAPEPADRFDVVVQSSDDKLMHLHSQFLMRHSKVFASIEDLVSTAILNPLASSPSSSLSIN